VQEGELGVAGVVADPLDGHVGGDVGEVAVCEGFEQSGGTWNCRAVRIRKLNSGVHTALFSDRLTCSTIPEE
jgi:hypothetical protein